MKIEDKLKKIVEAQVNGGYDTWETFSNDKVKLGGTYVGYHRNCNSINQCACSCPWTHILAILLDTQGCKAAYGERNRCIECGCLRCQCEYRNPLPTFELYGQYILEGWHSTELTQWGDGKFEKSVGNNWRLAIETAFDLLPQS